LLETLKRHEIIFILHDIFFNIMSTQILCQRQQYMYINELKNCGKNTQALYNILQMYNVDANTFYMVEGAIMEMARIPHVARPTQMIVKVEAASVNPLDTAMINGYGSNMINVLRKMDRAEKGIWTQDEIEFPLTVGRDFAGEVVYVGQSVKNIKVGNKVMGVVSPQAQGSHAEYVVTSENNVCHLPENINAIEGSSIPYVGLTAYSAIVVSGGVTRSNALGKRVIVLGASGGVGTFATQLLTAWGAEVRHIIGLFKSISFSELMKVEGLMWRGSFDLVLDACGTDDLVYMEALRPWMGSSYVTLSSPMMRNIDSNGLIPGLFESVRDVLCKNSRTVQEGKVYKWAFYMPNPIALKEIGKLVSKGMIRPIIDKVYPFEDALDAYDYVLAGNTKGKTVINLL
ncbi:unnamed protein product, partial [Meganyctiphanes norvegica]